MRNGRPLAFPFNATLLLSLAACITARLCYAQKIVNVDFEAVGNTIRIGYDIDGCSGNEKYDVKLLLGTDSEFSEIKYGLTGDVKDVECGSSKVILWDVFSDRDELKGPIYFAVEIQRIHRPDIQPTYDEEIEEPETIRDDKSWRGRSWKADKGYVGGSIGLFAPSQSHSLTPYNPQQNGFFVNTSIGYLPSLLVGVSSTIYFYGAPKLDNLRISLWKSWGVMIGPMISLPIGNRIKWEVRPQIGYSMIMPNSTFSDIDSIETRRSGVAYCLSTGLRLNFGKRTCYMLNVEYLSASRKFEDHEVEPDVGLIGASFGFAFRFY